MPKLFAIDTMAVLYRNYFAMIRNPLINSKGINTSGIFGVLSQILRVLDDSELEYLAVTSDLAEPTFRHKRFPEYKATREKMPDDLVAQLPYLPRLIEAMDLPYLTMAGYEADDIVGTLMRLCRENGIQGVMVTSDKDYMQLVSEQTVMLNHKSEIIDLAKVQEKFGGSPEQVIEVLGLMGDASDNIPGVRGVGEKTAIKLIQQYGGIAEVYENLENISGKKLKENLTEGKENAFLSRELVTIDCRVPLEIPLDSLKIDKSQLYGNSEFLSLLEELEFKSLLKRFQTEEKTVPLAVETPKEDYLMLDSLTQLEAAVEELKQQTILAFDTINSGNDIINDRLLGIAFCSETGKAFYLPLNTERWGDDQKRVDQLLQSLFGHSFQFIVGHDLKTAIQYLSHHGVTVPPNIFDTMVAAHLLETARNYDLGLLVSSRLQRSKKFQMEGDTKNQQLSMLDEDTTTLNYLCENADLIFQLHQVLLGQLSQTEMLKPFQQIEMPLIFVLARLEMTGVGFDMEHVAKISEDFSQQIEQLSQQIYDFAEETFNINSIIELQQVLYEKLKLHEAAKIRPKKIKIGNGLSTGEETLEKMKSFPLPNIILKYRAINKLKNTYIDQLPSFVNKTTQHIHSSFRQTIAATGRLASDNPNLQNIPIRSEEGRRIRKLFVPSSPDHVLVAADYSQIELRVVTHYSKDPTFLEGYRENLDVHALTASAIFNVPLEQVDRDMRAKAKEVNFGLIYRMGPDRLSIVTQTTKKEAKQFIEKYFEKYATIHALQELFLERARKEGFALTLMGRRRYLPEINGKGMGVRLAEGAAINTPIQGTAAEIIKMAMINIDRRLMEEKMHSKMILSVHDELVFDTLKEEQELLCQVVKHEMENVVSLEVPLVAEIGVGSNWLEAH